MRVACSRCCCASFRSMSSRSEKFRSAVRSKAVPSTEMFIFFSDSYSMLELGSGCASSAAGAAAGATSAMMLARSSQDGDKRSFAEQLAPFDPKTRFSTEAGFVHNPYRTIFRGVEPCTVSPALPVLYSIFVPGKIPARFLLVRGRLSHLARRTARSTSASPPAWFCSRETM